MRKLLITFDDETADMLQKQPNMSAFVRDAVMMGNLEAMTAEAITKLTKLIGLRLDALEESLKPLREMQTMPPVIMTGQSTDALAALNLGMACCKAAKPCKHWHFDDVQAVWVNELTKETRET